MASAVDSNAVAIGLILGVVAALLVADGLSSKLLS